MRTRASGLSASLPPWLEKDGRRPPLFAVPVGDRYHNVSTDRAGARVGLAASE
jgi:hypothetical protein